ncbi:hypothetical protein DIURU_001452 [Diutina rugosa]|uniref:Uncharacterized protein n=1 Tax=Diutina rugosa TaxID=5481 RepID=A0A642UUI4_DIURU|nr:uncharacterized protein DIURU_001452 [Diutina rugosa]KAA8905649.1 hypothetical protein DIURU_001452 [Diutina rugosa]
MTTFLTPHFSRRVSFSNVHPELDDPGCGPIYNLPAPSSRPPAQPMTMVNSGIEFNQRMFDKSSPFAPKSPPSAATGHVLSSRRKRLKLPDPPNKSILKNKVSPEQLLINETTINFHGDLDELASFTAANIDNVASSSMNGANGDGVTAPPRRKSYAEMTDEELMQLDPQYAQKSVNVSQYKFDSKSGFYAGTSKTNADPAYPTAKYASSGVDNYKSVSLTVKHNGYEQCTTNRTILAYISGRRHSWNGLDWMLSYNQPVTDSEIFLTHGDYLVVAALIPQRFITDHAKLNKRNRLEEVLHDKGNQILEHLLTSPLLSQHDLRLKITVELIMDNVIADTPTVRNKKPQGNKYALGNLYRQYHPNMLVMGTKSANFNFKYPTQRKQSARDEYLVKLTSYVMKYSVVPVLLVGPSTKWHNASAYEKRRASTSLKFAGDSRGRSTHREMIPETSSRSSSIASSDSVLSAVSFTGSDLVKEKSLPEQVDQLWHSNSPNRFADALALVSDRAWDDAHGYLTAVSSKGESSLPIDSRIHQIYRSQTTSGYVMGGTPIGTSQSPSHSRESGVGGSVNGGGCEVYKVKSMLAADPPKPKKTKPASFSVPSTTITPAEMKKRSNSMTSASSSSEKEKKSTSIWKKLGLKK